MNQEIQTRIDNVLKNITEPQTLLSVFDINFVEKVSYSEEQKRILIHTRDAAACGKQCFSASLATGMVRESLGEKVLEGMKKEFGSFWVEIAD